MPNLVRRFVFVTGDFTTPDSRAFLERTGQPVVAKPYEVAELLAAVALVLRQRST
jgi:DNA-binding response OmpR family regulator